VELILESWLFYDPLGGDDVAKITARKEKPKTAPERRLVCGSCGYPIARESDRTTIDGDHAHTCTNPHGVAFHIGCFSEAGGCKAVGPSTGEFSWFAGYVWTVAVCRHCDAHLGWLFRSASNRFFGLILDRLAARES